jgi:hypothetical protein
MTSTEHRPPLQAVHLAQHDDRAAWQLDRQRFAAFLTAKDLILGYTRTATEGAGRLAARLHLEGLFTMVRRSYGWLLGAASVAARGLRVPGVLAGLVWGLSTDVGQSLMAKAVGSVSTAVSTVAGAIGTAVGWTLRLFGTPGARLATGSAARRPRSSRQPPTGPGSCSASVGCCGRRTCPRRRWPRSPGNACYGSWWAASCPARGPGWSGSWRTSLCCRPRCSATPAPSSPESSRVCTPPRPPHRTAPHRQQPIRRPRLRCRPSCPLRHRQRRPRHRDRSPSSRSRSPPGTATCSSRPSGQNLRRCATRRPSGRWPRSAANPRPSTTSTTSTARTTSGRSHPGGGLRHAQRRRSWC